YRASTEKSPQPGHQVGWSAETSFLVSPLRSGRPKTCACVGAPADSSVMLLIAINKFFLVDFSGAYIFRTPVLTTVWARSMISRTFQVSPSVLVMPRIFGSQKRARSKP